MSRPGAHGGDPRALARRLAGCLPRPPDPLTSFARAAIGDGAAGSTPPPGQALRTAAVLVPVVARAQGISVMLTRRTEHLARHAGQISFPGGLMEAGDADLVETALRETEEETGVRRAFVQVVGSLDECRTGTGYAILPVVGVLEPGFELAPDAREVSEVFEVPLSFVLDARNHRRQTRRVAGRDRPFYVIEYQRRSIWGATAAMLVNFHEKLRAGNLVDNLVAE